MAQRFRIVCDEEDTRVDIFLADKLAITRSKVKSLIEDGHILAEGKRLKPSQKVKKAMVIEGVIPEEAPLELVAQPIPLTILFEDEYILAIDKPHGMVVHPSAGHRDGTLVNAILSYLNTFADTEHRRLSFEHSFASLRPYIVHRLDKGTSGVILIAKNTHIQEMLSALFKKRLVQKTYRAVVEGLVKKDEGTIGGNIGRHPKERKKMAVLREGGREAVTGFKVIQRLDGFTYIEAYPKTGRTHQIRVHLSSMGHPVVGDELYGKQAKYMAQRTLLHAFRIECVHPVKNIPLCIEAPIPRDMQEFIQRYAATI